MTAKKKKDPEPEPEQTLGGTDSEQGPDTGVGGTHPAPAAMRNEDGELHVAGEAIGTPRSDAPGEVEPEEVDEEALAKLNEEHEPDQIETERPDVGTE